jgi:hypothetical protein
MVIIEQVLEFLPISLLVGLADAAPAPQHGLQALLYYRHLTTRLPSSYSSATASTAAPWKGGVTTRRRVSVSGGRREICLMSSGGGGPI